MISYIWCVFGLLMFINFIGLSNYDAPLCTAPHQLPSCINFYPSEWLERAVIVVMSYKLGTITQYGGTVYIGIAMVYPHWKPYIYKDFVHFHFQFESFNDQGEECVKITSIQKLVDLLCKTCVISQKVLSSFLPCSSSSYSSSFSSWRSVTQ